MLVSANGYTQIKVNTMITEVKRPVIDNKVEHLNIKLYQKNFTIHYPSSSDPSEKVYIYKEETPDYTIIVEGDYTYGFTYEKKIKSFPYNYFIFKRFYPNFSIWNKFVGAEFNNGSTIHFNKGYEFDEAGKLTKEINYDEGWGFSYEQVVKFVQDKYNEHIFKKMSVIKMSENSRKYWFIYSSEYFKQTDEIKLDAQTGEILSHRILLKDPILPLRIIKVVLPDKTDKNYKKDTIHTFQGKNYTEEEQKAFEQEQWEKYQAKRNKKGFWDINLVLAVV